MSFINEGNNSVHAKVSLLKRWHFLASVGPVTLQKRKRRLKNGTQKQTITVYSCVRESSFALICRKIKGGFIILFSSPLIELCRSTYNVAPGPSKQGKKCWLPYFNIFSSQGLLLQEVSVYAEREGLGGGEGYENFRLLVNVEILEVVG